jgi:hypothetical protein
MRLPASARASRELLLALALAAAVVASRELQYAEVRYDRFHVPAFDGHVYLAMAESPATFTVAPWGYRVLLPWLISALPLPHPVPAFFWSTVLGLIAGGVLLHVYLRRLGNGVLASLAAVVVFGASGPVGEVVRYQFLVEPLTFVLELAFLLALQAGAGTFSLALVALLGTLSKEFFLLLLPLVYLVRRGRDGDRRALTQALLVSIPCLLSTWLLRAYWTPHIATPLPSPATSTLHVALTRFAETYAHWGPATLLHGLTPLAMLGAWRVRARPLVLPAVYLVLATLVSPFLNPVAFFATDIRRLLLYALPALLPLAVAAIDPLLPGRQAPSPPAAWPARRERASAVGVLVLLVLPLLVVDRYRRLDMQGSRDALRVLAVCRETLRTARELEQGGSFVFDAGAGRFSQGVRDHNSLVDLRHVRWFLAEDWGLLEPRQAGEAVLEGRSGSIVLPCFRPQDLEVRLVLHSREETVVALGVNGRGLGEVRVGPEPVTHRQNIPGRLLFRGDNLLRLTLPRPAPGGLQLSAFTLSAARGGP